MDCDTEVTGTDWELVLEKAGSGVGAGGTPDEAGVEEFGVMAGAEVVFSIDPPMNGIMGIPISPFDDGINVDVV